MIGSLRGRLLDRGGAETLTEALTEVLIEVTGVGYRVVTAPTTAVALGEVGEEVFVWVHHHVREDAETLYGFTSRAERATFEALLGAHGVGPSLALAILSVHDPSALARVLHDDDVAALCLVPGVGKKTAARLLVELKARLDIPEVELAPGPGSGNGVDVAIGASSTTVQADVRAALAGLGYTSEEIRVAMAELPDELPDDLPDDRPDGDEAATLLRAALTALASGAPRPTTPSRERSQEEI